MTGLRIAVLALLTAWLGACQSDLDRRYLDASLGKRLDLPPDLIGPQTEASFDLPEVFYRGKGDAGKGLPVLVNVKSARLEGSGNLYWLRVEDPVERLYPLAREFWAAEGFRLELDQPAIGVMRTQWNFSEQGQSGGNWLQDLFGNENIANAQDQFTTRLERDGDGASRIYIAHRGMLANWVDAEEKLLQKQDNLKTKSWSFRRSEPELEVEMLSRLMIFLGLEKLDVERQRTQLALLAPRATLEINSDGKAPVLMLNDPYQVAWNRIYHQLERMDYKIVEANLEQDLTGVGNISVEIELDEPEEEDEGGFFSWLTSVNKGSRIFRLKLAIDEEDNRWTRVRISSTNVDAPALQRRDEFARLLHSQVR